MTTFKILITTFLGNPSVQHSLTIFVVSIFTLYIDSIFSLTQIVQSIGFQARYVIFGVKILIPFDLIFSKLAVFYKAAKEKQMVCCFYSFSSSKAPMDESLDKVSTYFPALLCLGLLWTLPRS